MPSSTNSEVATTPISPPKIKVLEIGFFTGPVDVDRWAWFDEGGWTVRVTAAKMSKAMGRPCDKLEGTVSFFSKLGEKKE